MGIVLTVLEPPHPPEPNLVNALPPEAGRVIDAEPHLVSPRYDTLLVTTRGLVVRDHVSGDFSGIPWANFSLEAHLRQYSRHAVLLLWLDDRRPIEVAVTRRLALNIAAVAPVLKSNPTAPIDDVVLADPHPEVLDLREPVGAVSSTVTPTDRAPILPAPIPVPLVTFNLDRSPPPTRASIDRRRHVPRRVVGVAVLVLAGVVGGITSIVVSTDDSPAGGAVSTITSESVDVGAADR